MKMDRNINNDGTGKYAVVNLRRVLALEGTDDHKEARIALEALERIGVLEWGRVGEPDEFFLVKLKDLFAPGALRGYAAMASGVDPEWAGEVREMISRAGIDSPFCQHPD